MNKKSLSALTEGAKKESACIDRNTVHLERLSVQLRHQGLVGQISVCSSCLPVAEVSKHTIQHGLCLFKQLDHCLEQGDPHNVEESQLHTHTYRHAMSAMDLDAR